MRARILASCSVMAIGLLTSVFACDGEKIEVSCDQIPDGGCPSAGDADLCTADPTCNAVYRCRDTRWTLVQTCSARPVVLPRDAASDASTPSDASLFDGPLPDGAWGGPGCLDLQAPDCSLGLALSCGSGCCGCEDVFVCKAGTWTTWGVCQGGKVTEVP
ncbi:MAG: hypothetical protein U0174_07515 [Polyangiaceae bacterium]